MTAPLTPDEIAAMVVDADDWFRVNGNHPVRGDELAKHVRALAAECERRDLVHVNEVIALQRAVDGRGETIDSLEAELEAVTSERDRYKAALTKITGVRTIGASKSSAQGQSSHMDIIAREALKGAG